MAVLKAKNQIDLLDFKIEVVGDNPDDWDEIRDMRGTIHVQTERIQGLEKSDAQLKSEVQFLRSQLAEARDLNDQNRDRIQALEEENGQLKQDHASLQVKNAADAKTVGSLTKENKELTEQLEERLENIRKLISRNE